MFSDRSGTAVLERFEEYKDLLKSATDRADEGRDFFVARSAGGDGFIQRDVRPSAALTARRSADRDTLETLAKSLPPDQAAAMSAQLESLKENLAKDWDASFPASSSLTVPAQLAPIDLEGPAKLLVPRQTPLANQMPRENNAVGSALQYRRITGWSNGGVGGVPDLMPFLNTEYPSSQSTNNLPQFGGYANTTGGVTSGGLGLRRGQRITYKSDAAQVTFTELSLSDVVSTKAYYIGQGYQDVRHLSATALLWAHKGAEERAMLYSRGPTATGYTGPIAAPGNPTVTVAAGGAIAAGVYKVVITAVGSGGESVTNPVEQSVTTATTNLAVQVVFPALPAGATGWNIYMTTIGVAGGPYFFQTFVPSGLAQWTLLTNATTGGSLPTIATTGDTTANPNGYDGMLTVLLNPTVSGYVANLVSNAFASFATSTNSVGGGTTMGGTAITTPVGDAPWQTAFAALYGASTQPGNYAMSQGGLPATAWPWTGGTAYGQKLLADPDVVFVDGAVRAAMGQFVRKAAGGSTAYRITMQQPDVSTNGMEIGAVVNGIANQVTGKMVDFNVHPYMPAGSSLIWSKSLPFPDSEISNTIVAKNVQDYLYQAWPQIQFTYDASTYQLGTLVFYAPAWSGAITGLLP
jgi:hypothetical protein